MGTGVLPGKLRDMMPKEAAEEQATLAAAGER